MTVTLIDGILYFWAWHGHFNTMCTHMLNEIKHQYTALIMGIHVYGRICLACPIYLRGGPDTFRYWLWTLYCFQSMTVITLEIQVLIYSIDF